MSNSDVFFSGAMSDLNKAIELSHGQGKVACQAYTQRGLIKRLESKNGPFTEVLLLSMKTKPLQL